jgi:hypothetical protein
VTNRLAGEDDDRVPVERVLQGLSLHPLEDGWAPIEALVVVKCLDDEAEVAWLYRTTSNLNREEILGALLIQVELIREELLAEWIDDD